MRKLVLLAVAALAAGACSEATKEPTGVAAKAPTVPAVTAPKFDDIANNIDASIDAVAEVMPLTVGGTNGTTQFYVTPRNGDGKNGCNLTGSTTLVVSILSSDASVATVSPSSITFGSCGDTPTLTITPVAQGSATISVTQSSNNSGGTFNLAPATFTVNVAPPPNTPPQIAVTGVTGGTSYEIGSVPTAGCSVTDAEDGKSTFAATLSAISGPLAAYGLGEQTASCSYTDAGGLTASASVTYGIVDTHAPVITYLGRTPAISNGWNNGDVTVTWTCSDAVSGVVEATVSKTVTSEGTNQSATGTCTDNAGNTATDTQTGISIDKTAPAITFVSRTPANNYGWNNGDVTVDWSCTDSGSGVVSATVSQSVSAEGANQSAEGTCEDKVGNKGADTQTGINIDKTPPTATATADPAANANKWNNTDVKVSFSGTDGLSDIASCSAPVVLTNEGANQSASGNCTDKAGNTSVAASLVVNIDKSAPKITFVSRTTANANGWNNGDVTVNWTCSDGVSGVESATVSQSVSSEGADQSAKGTCADLAGNTASDTQTGISIDKTAPTLIGAPTTAANTADWYNSNVTIQWTCSDALSGLAGTCPANSTISSEGANLTASASVSDKAGNTTAATSSPAVNIDKTAPTVTGAATTSPNAFGWYKGDVTIHWTCTDNLSGVAVSACPSDVLITGEGNNLGAGPVSATDLAGNTGSGSVSGIKIDRTAPDVSLVGGPENGKTYYYGFVPAAPTCSASDALSGVDGSCSVSGYGTTVGSQTVTASATDKAGNSASASATYTVLAWTLNGFFQPVDMSTSGTVVFNTVKGGSTVPLKFEVFAGPTELTDVSYVKSLTSASVSCGLTALTDDIEVTATGGTSLRYDPVAGQFVYNWQTPRTPGACLKITMTTQDGSSLAALFKLK